MSSRLLLAAVAAMTLAAPALSPSLSIAQTAPAAPAAAAPAAAPTEEDVDAAGEVFQADMEALAGELAAAKTEAGADTAKANAAADAIVAKYQPKADAFATLIEAFLKTQALPAEAEAGVTAGMAQLRGAPKQVRDRVMAETAPVPQ